MPLIKSFSLSSGLVYKNREIPACINCCQPLFDSLPVFNIPEKTAVTTTTSPTHTNFEMGSSGCSPEPISFYS